VANEIVSNIAGRNTANLRLSCPLDRFLVVCRIVFAPSQAKKLRYTARAFSYRRLFAVNEQKGYDRFKKNGYKVCLPGADLTLYRHLIGAQQSVRIVFNFFWLSFFGRPPMRPRAQATLRPGAMSGPVLSVIRTLSHVKGQEDYFRLADPHNQDDQGLSAKAAAHHARNTSFVAEAARGGGGADVAR
jgi:hypothetical protein